MAKAFYGIDLGTTHTLVIKAEKEASTWKYTKLKLPNFPINDDDEIKETELLPSAVYFGEDGNVVVGEYAKEAIHFDPEHVYINSKIDLGGRLKKNDHNEHTPLEVSTQILKVCFSRIVEDGGIKASVRISVPAAFSQDKRSDTEKAANMALAELGYTDVKLVKTTEEPYAALVNLVINEKQFVNMVNQEKNTIMLVDIGGGTMDIIISDITKVDNDLSARTSYAPAKHDEFAGAKFDYEIMKKFMEDMMDHYGIKGSDIAEIDRVILEKRMLLIAEDAKKFLCKPENRDRTFQFTCDFRNPGFNTAGKEAFKVSLTKKQMDKTLDGLLNSRDDYSSYQSISRIIKKTLMDNELTADDIDCIYLTGGMANYDQITNTIRSVIHKPVIVAEEPLFCTATGVALSLVYMNPDGRTEITRDIREKLVKRNNSSSDSQPAEDYEQSVDNFGISISETRRIGMSYFIDVEDSMPVQIISANETYPCMMKRSNIQLKTSSQSRMNLVLYEGHSVYDCNMKLLRKKTVEFNEMMPVGTSIDISYKIDPNKLITIYASIDGEAPFEFSTEEE